MIYCYKCKLAFAKWCADGMAVCKSGAHTFVDSTHEKISVEEIKV